MSSSGSLYKIGNNTEYSSLLENDFMKATVDPEWGRRRPTELLGGHFVPAVRHAQHVEGGLNKKYEHVYVSIGGKVNEFYFHCNNPLHCKIYTNSMYQLIPNFLQCKDIPEHNINILIITIDDYSNSHSYELNKSVIMKHKSKNMDIVMFDSLCNSLFLEQFLTTTISFLTRHNINSDHFMICNYIKYKNEPNLLEQQLSKEIPISIHRILQNTANSEYNACFYDWYGYRTSTYNLIYNYKKYYLNTTFPYNETVSSIQKHIVGLPFCFDSDYGIVNSTRVNSFWEHSIDITSVITDNNCIALSLTTQFDLMKLPV